MSIEVVPQTQHTGAEIRGVTLSPDLDDTTVEEIRNALLQWKVVFFRDQDLDRDAHVALGARFGEVNLAHPTLPPRFPDHPEIVAIQKDAHGHDDPDETILEHRWHSDVTYAPNPPMGSILRAVELPPYGGDTEWTNLAAAYSGLSAPIKAMIDDLTAIHHNVLHLMRGEPNQLQKDFESVRLRARHPIVSIHPETGERVLYVNPDFTSHIYELTRQEGAHVLACLYEQLASREFTVRFRWQPGSVAFWDNRATAHRAPLDVPEGFHREMERITLRGEPLNGPTGYRSTAFEPATTN